MAGGQVCVFCKIICGLPLTWSAVCLLHNVALSCEKQVNYTAEWGMKGEGVSDLAMPPMTVIAQQQDQPLSVIYHLLLYTRCNKVLT